MHRSHYRILPGLLALLTSVALAADLANDRYSVDLVAGERLRVTSKDGAEALFGASFVIQSTATDPSLAMRPGGIRHVPYNVPTWKAPHLASADALKAVKRSNAQGGDGFDDSILDGDTQQRTADAYKAAPSVALSAVSARKEGDAILFSFPENQSFALSARLALPSGDGEPVLTYTFTPKSKAWYSVAYVGAPEAKPSALEELWQPFIWQEKRFPSRSYLTPAFECSLPATFMRVGGATVGVVADPDEFPFDPLPVLANSRFGVALRDAAGAARPALFAPLLGGAESRRDPGKSYAFRLRLYVAREGISQSYETLARRLYGFRDFRHSPIVSLNQTLDNMIDYGMSQFSWFVSELKGCAYSTDVPDAVKNVSALNPLDLALVTDDESIFRERAYPIVEYLLSREKFLFSLDSKQKTQSPSRAMKGPCAPVSELAALYGITDGASPVFLKYSKELLKVTRTLNLDDVSEAGSWQSQLAVYRATGDRSYLEHAIRGADEYLARRVDRPAGGFDEPGLFFWTAFTPKWMDLLELYEATGQARYLEAAHKAARQFALFTWVSPRIPDAEILVNRGNKAPLYGYLAGKGHKPMFAAEEKVPAWRLSEMGLTPESSGTMSGHRAIFMATHAPWMMRLSLLTGDRFLHDIARSAIVGRYANFPGYHINTARTTIYEKPDYPLRKHVELSMNSFHYNHIWPHMSILLDYLVSDAFARSRGQIDFPSRFIEGYGYLSNKFYGDRPGRFYQHDDAVLWMPRGLLKPGTPELSYIAARGKNSLYLALANQSDEALETEIVLDAALLPQVKDGVFPVHFTVEESLCGPDGTIHPVTQASAAPRTWSVSEMRDGRLKVRVPSRGLFAAEVAGLVAKPRFQNRLLEASKDQAWRQDYAEIASCDGRAMVLNFGPTLQTAYLYLRADDSRFKAVRLTYDCGEGKKTLEDRSYPFEFTIPLPEKASAITGTIECEPTEGGVPVADAFQLSR